MRNIMRMMVVMALVIASISSVASMAVAAPPAGSISGAVYEADGTTPIGAAIVTAYDNVGTLVATAYSSGYDGAYTIPELGTGDYRVLARADGYFSEYYLDTDNISSATTVPVSDNAVLGIDFTLAPGGSISGTVSSDNGTPIYSARIVVLDDVTHVMVDETWMTSTSNAYRVGHGMPAGSYDVRVEAVGYFSEYYDNVTDIGSATPVTVTFPNETSGIDFNLTPGGIISGSLFSDTSAPIFGGHVTAFDNTTGVLVEVDEVWISDTSNAYSLGTDLPTGNYVVLAEADGYFGEYYNNVTDPDLATLVTVVAPGEVSGINFSLLPHAPMVSTNPASGITATSAVLNGALTSLGAASSDNVSFEWGLSTSYDSETTPRSMSATGSFSDNLTGLSAKTTYHFRAKAVGDGTTWGDDVTFTTSTIAPLVTTNDASNPATTSATLNGNLTDKGTAASVTVSFIWGTASGVLNQETNPTGVMGSTGTYHFDLGGLTPGTTYYYKAKAVGDGTSYGVDEKSLTTSTTAPSVTTNDASNPATTSATLNGNLTALGTAGSVIVSFEWGTTAGGPYTNVTDNQTMTTTGAFTADLTGLTAGATYYCRAKAVGHGTAVGDEVSFATSTTPPTVTTSAATSLATTSATLNGNLGSLGTATNVAVTFEWGTTASYGSETAAQSMTAMGAFTANLNGLTANTTYHFRAKAVGDGSAVYGDDMIFTTASLADTTAPVISVVNSSNLTVSGATITWTTNEASTSQVDYGLTEEYGSTTTPDTNLVNTHSVDLTGLKAGKTYHYRVISGDAAGNQAVSADSTLTTDARSGGMPVWAWVLIGLAAVGVFGGAAFFIRGRLAKQEQP